MPDSTYNSIYTGEQIDEAIGQILSGGGTLPTPEEIGAAPAYTYSTTDLTAGTSSLTTGTLYFVYE